VFGFPDILDARHPDTRLHGVPATDQLGETLQDQQESGDRNQRLEEIDLDPGGGIPADFLIAPAVRRNLGAKPEQRQNAGEEEKQIKDEIDPRLLYHREQAVEDITTNMRILRQRIGTRHQE